MLDIITVFYLNNTSSFYCIVECSEWSHCSESCGTGFRVRTCGKNEVREPCQERTNNCEPVSGTKSPLKKIS